MTADDIGPDQPELNVIALLQSALDTFPLPSVAIDPAMRIVAVNVALREFLDEPALEVTTYEDLARRYLTEGNAKRVSETVRQAMTEATPRSSVEVEVTARRDFVFRIEIRRLEVPGIELYVATHLDLTRERRRIEELERLRVERERTQRIARVGSWRLDVRTSENTWSPEMYVIMGQDPATFFPTRENRRRLQPPSAEGAIGEIDRAIAGGHPFRSRYEIIRPGGGRRLIENVGEPQRDALGEVVAYLGTVRDVTEEVAHERELERERRRLERAQAISQTGDIEVDLTSGVATASPEFRRLFDLDDDALVDMETLQSRVHPDDRTRMMLFWTDPRAAVRESANDVIYRVITRTGDVRHLRGRAQMRVSADGHEYISAFAQDITQQVRADEHLRLSEQRLREAEAIAHVGHWEWFVRTGVLNWSDEVFAIAGVDHRIAPTYRGFLDLIHPEDRERVTASVQAALDDDEPYEIVHRMVRPGGEVRTVLERGELSRNPDGSPYRMLGVVQDITDAVAATEQLRLSEARLRAAEEIAGVGNWEWDTRTGEIEWSDEMYRIYGRDRDYSPHSDTYLELVHPEDRRHVADEALAVLRGEHLVDHRHRIVHPDGTVRVVRRNARVVERDERGRAVLLVGTAQDITEAVSAEERIRDRESRLNLAVEVAHLGHWEWNLQDDTLTWSDENYRIHGVEPGTPLPPGGEFGQFIHPEGREEAQEAMRATLRGERDYDVTHRLLCPDGVERTFHTVARVVERDERGRAVRVLGTVQDVTEQAEHQRELERLTALLAHADQMARLAPYEWDPKARSFWWSEQLYEVVGYAREDLPATVESLTRLIHPDDHDRAWETWSAGSRARAGWDMEYRIVRGDGAVLVVRDLSAWMPAERGDGGFFRGAIQDITHLAELRQQAEEAASEVISIIDASLLPIIVIDEHGTVQRANGATERVFGWDVEELVGLDVGVLAAGLTQQQHSGYLAHYLETGGASTPEGLVVGRTREVRGRRRDGSEFPAQLTVAEAELGTGRRQFVGIVMDLTEQKTTEEHLRQMQKSEALGTLVAGVAHDFNNLLTAIRGGIDMAQEFPDQSRWLEIATQASDRAAEVVRQLLRFSRRDEPQQIELDPAEMIREATTLSRETLDRRIWFTSHADEDLPPILGDPGQMQQVLLNLIVNARDAVLEKAEQQPGTFEPAIQVSARAQSIEGVPGVVFEVRDNGTGMTDEVRERALDPFFTTKPADRGTGLGLAAVTGIIQRHEGQIRIHTKLGEGTDFGVWLPSRRREDSESPFAEGREEPRWAAQGEAPAVLIVDDEEPLGAIAAAYLRSAGFEALAFTNGDDALAEAGRRRINLAVLDVNMPSPNGWEVLAALRRRDPDLPVIVCSGFADDEDARGRGATAVLAKPYTRAQLVDAVRTALSASAEGASEGR